MAIYQERRKWTNYAKENTYILFFSEKKEPYLYTSMIFYHIKFDVSYIQNILLMWNEMYASLEKKLNIFWYQWNIIYIFFIESIKIKTAPAYDFKTIYHH